MKNYELKTYKDLQTGNFPKSETELIDWFKQNYPKSNIYAIKKLYEDRYNCQLDLERKTVKIPSWW